MRNVLLVPLFPHLTSHQGTKGGTHNSAWRSWHKGWKLYPREYQKIYGSLW